MNTNIKPAQAAVFLQEDCFFRQPCHL